MHVAFFVNDLFCFFCFFQQKLQNKTDRLRNEDKEFRLALKNIISISLYKTSSKAETVPDLADVELIDFERLLPKSERHSLGSLKM